MASKTPITVAHGDGIGPEIMSATLLMLQEGGANLELHEVEIGEKVYLKGHQSGIEPQTLETIRNTKAFLKAPITTPQGGGFKSLNVSIRGFFGLYANVRPCVSYAPFIKTKHPSMDVVIIRENEEDLYTGIEYQQTADAVQALKVITRTGSEKIIRYAFEYAQKNGRKKVTCFTKDNILKLSDGLFHKVFQEIAKEYPDLENEHWIVDIGSAKLADTPENFDVLVVPNLYGDILSDIAAQIAGSVGLAGSANIGANVAMFEAIHGSAPRRAGQNLANPSGLLHGALLMLRHLDQIDAAATIQNAWLRTVEDGIHTYDIFKDGISKEKVGTQEFAKAVASRMGQKPQQLPAVTFKKNASHTHIHPTKQRAKPNKSLVGVDIFVDSSGSLVELQKKLTYSDLKLTMIANRGVCVWPNTISPDMTCLDQWRCRFMSQQTKGAQIEASEVIALLQKLLTQGIDITKTENLYTFNGTPGYSLSQQEQ